MLIISNENGSPRAKSRVFQIRSLLHCENSDVHFTSLI